MIRSSSHHCRSAFTLLEVILALAIMSVLAVSLFTCMQVAFKTKRGAEESLEVIRDPEAAMDLLRAEFESALPPRGTMSRAFVGRGFMGANGGRDDDVSFFTAAPMPPGVGRQLGSPPPMAADIKQVQLIVVTLENTGERCLARRVTSNLLPPEGVEMLPDDEILVRNVTSLQFRYYDGLLWQDEWDSSLNYDALPAAVEVTLELGPTEARINAGDLRPLRISRVIQFPCTGEGDLEREPTVDDTTGAGGANTGGAPGGGV